MIIRGLYIWKFATFNSLQSDWPWFLTQIKLWQLLQTVQGTDCAGADFQGQTVQGQTVQGQTVQGQTCRGRLCRGSKQWSNTQEQTCRGRLYMGALTLFTESRFHRKPFSPKIGTKIETLLVKRENSVIAAFGDSGFRRKRLSVKAAFDENGFRWKRHSMIAAFGEKSQNSMWLFSPKAVFTESPFHRINF